jgi:hypothetical protein
MLRMRAAFAIRRAFVCCRMSLTPRRSMPPIFLRRFDLYCYYISCWLCLCHFFLSSIQLRHYADCHAATPAIAAARAAAADADATSHRRRHFAAAALITPMPSHIESQTAATPPMPAERHSDAAITPRQPDCCHADIAFFRRAILPYFFRR